MRTARHAVIEPGHAATAFHITAACRWIQGGACVCSSARVLLVAEGQVGGGFNAVGKGQNGQCHYADC